jgi:hypothetical protein
MICVPTHIMTSMVAEDYTALQLMEMQRKSSNDKEAHRLQGTSRPAWYLNLLLPHSEHVSSFTVLHEARSTSANVCPHPGLGQR